MDSKVPLPEAPPAEVIFEDYALHEAPPAEVVFEDYLFYAALQRQEEDAVGRQTSSQGSDSLNVAEKKTWFAQALVPTEKGRDTNIQYPPMTADEAERANASRALRLASWVSVFYLITTDILGPFNAPYAISQVGWVAGVVLYFISSVHFSQSVIRGYLNVFLPSGCRRHLLRDRKSVV